MGSMAVSAGEALALTAAILGHADPRSTAIYAHVQTNPSIRAANRVSEKIAAALAGEPIEDVKADPVDELFRSLLQRLAEAGPDSARIRTELARLLAPETSSS
jgi:hypothetical protein